MYVLIGFDTSSNRFDADRAGTLEQESRLRRHGCVQKAGETVPLHLYNFDSHRRVK